MTLGDILTDLKARIGPGNYTQDAQLKTWINEAYLYMCDQIAQENPDYFTTSDTTDLIANQFEYWLPSDCERVIMVNANFTGTWRHLTPLQEIGQVPVLANVQNPIVFTEVNPVYYITGGKLGILPLNTGTNVTGGIKLWYVQNPSDLADGASPQFPTKYHHLIAIGAYANYLDLDDQHQAAEATRNRFEQRVQEMVETMAERQLDVPKIIEIVQDQGLYFDPSYSDGNAY